MPTTSVKHRDFIGEPMGEKEVTALAGIGDVAGKKLSEQGFDKVQSIPTTSVKHRDFIGEPMGEKEVTALAGIGDVAGKKLSEQGFDKVQSIPTTSVKHRDFIGEPMGEKEVTALAGIGDVAGKKLSEQGFDKAYVVLGQFLMLKKDKELFMEWMKDTAGSNKHNAESTADCLNEWCEQHL